MVKEKGVVVVIIDQDDQRRWRALQGIEKTLQPSLDLIISEFVSGKTWVHLKSALLTIVEELSLVNNIIEL